jgi:hypothetical protein
MPPTPRALPFKDVLLSVAREIRDQQTRLDQDHLARRAAFLLLLREAKDSGHETLVRGLAPSEELLPTLPAVAARREISAAVIPAIMGK